ncbi:uncharacterized protein LOC142234170 isoform X2 [Haematobia irritans]|uniref:uncharacterized protein LOC142234170 isoform X2 n=1 Tax=Haematobia irritans TaxID=7368 RepID=UPI003F4FDD4A
MGHLFNDFNYAGKNVVYERREETIERNANNAIRKRRSITKEMYPVIVNNEKVENSKRKDVSTQFNKDQINSKARKSASAYHQNICNEHRNYEKGKIQSNARNGICKDPNTSSHIRHLKRAFSHEINKLRRQHSALKRNQLHDGNQISSSTTWAERMDKQIKNPINRQTKVNNPDEVQVKKYSNRYSNDRDVESKFQTRKITSQMLDSGAVGDHNSRNRILGKSPELPNGIITYSTTNEDSSSYRHRRKITDLNTNYFYTPKSPRSPLKSPSHLKSTLGNPNCVENLNFHGKKQKQNENRNESYRAEIVNSYIKSKDNHPKKEDDIHRENIASQDSGPNWNTCGKSTSTKHLGIVEAPDLHHNSLRSRSSSLLTDMHKIQNLKPGYYSSEPQYSLEVLRVLKTMKIQEYKPIKPNSKNKDMRIYPNVEKPSEVSTKEQNYQEYVRQYEMDSLKEKCRSDHTSKNRETFTEYAEDKCIEGNGNSMQHPNKDGCNEDLGGCPLEEDCQQNVNETYNRTNVPQEAPQHTTYFSKSWHQTSTNVFLKSGIDKVKKLYSFADQSGINSQGLLTIPGIKEMSSTWNKDGQDTHHEVLAKNKISPEFPYGKKECYIPFEVLEHHYRSLDHDKEIVKNLCKISTNNGILERNQKYYSQDANSSKTVIDSGEAKIKSNREELRWLQENSSNRTENFSNTTKNSRMFDTLLQDPGNMNQQGFQNPAEMTFPILIKKLEKHNISHSLHRVNDTQQKYYPQDPYDVESCVTKPKLIGLKTKRVKAEKIEEFSNTKEIAPMINSLLPKSENMKNQILEDNITSHSSDNRFVNREEIAEEKQGYGQQDFEISSNGLENKEMLELQEKNYSIYPSKTDQEAESTITSSATGYLQKELHKNLSPMLVKNKNNYTKIPKTFISEHHGYEEVTNSCADHEVIKSNFCNYDTQMESDLVLDLDSKTQYQKSPCTSVPPDEYVLRIENKKYFKDLLNQRNYVPPEVIEQFVNKYHGMDSVHRETKDNHRHRSILESHFSKYVPAQLWTEASLGGKIKSHADLTPGNNDDLFQAGNINQMYSIMETTLKPSKHPQSTGNLNPNIETYEEFSHNSRGRKDSSKNDFHTKGKRIRRSNSANRTQEIHKNQFLQSFGVLRDLCLYNSSSMTTHPKTWSNEIKQMRNILPQENSQYIATNSDIKAINESSKSSTLPSPTFASRPDPITSPSAFKLPIENPQNQNFIIAKDKNQDNDLMNSQNSLELAQPKSSTVNKEAAIGRFNALTNSILKGEDLNETQDQEIEKNPKNQVIIESNNPKLQIANKLHLNSALKTSIDLMTIVSSSISNNEKYQHDLTQESKKKCNTEILGISYTEEYPHETKPVINENTIAAEFFRNHQYSTNLKEVPITVHEKLNSKDVLQQETEFEESTCEMPRKFSSNKCLNKRDSNDKSIHTLPDMKIAIPEYRTKEYNQEDVLLNDGRVNDVTKTNIVLLPGEDNPTLELTNIIPSLSSIQSGKESDFHVPYITKSESSVYYSPRSTLSSDTIHCQYQSEASRGQYERYISANEYNNNNDLYGSHDQSLRDLNLPPIDHLLNEIPSSKHIVESEYISIEQKEDEIGDTAEENYIPNNYITRGHYRPRHFQFNNPPIPSFRGCPCMFKTYSRICKIIYESRS